MSFQGRAPRVWGALAVLCLVGCSASEGMPRVTPGSRDRVTPRGNDGGVPTNEADGGLIGPRCESIACGDGCCEVGELCDGDSCCAPEALCAGTCCGAGLECEIDRCVPVCDEGTLCETADGPVCCGGAQLCLLGACIDPGPPCVRSTDCDEGSYCDSTSERCLPRAESGDACEYRPPVGPFELTLEWAWEGDTVLPAHDQVMSTPMVANLNDDDGDGDIDVDDVPDVVFLTFTRSSYNTDGVLRAISGRDGSRIFPTADPGYRVNSSGHVAIAELIASSPGPEIVTCLMDAASTTLGITSASGEILRRFDRDGLRVPCASAAPAIADMDGDGVPEIAIGFVVARADGTVPLRGRDVRPYVTFANVDDDEDLEIVGANAAMNLDGTFVWDRSPANSGGYVALADLNLDGSPEVIVVTPAEHSITALNARTGATVWGPMDVNPPEVAAEVASDTRGGTGGGPPTIANFDDDPEPEIAFAGGYGYVVFEHDGSRHWFAVTTDRSSRVTGSSIFDFEGDGLAEVVYNDERNLRVYRGGDGTVIDQRCNTSGTLAEYPVIVDVDNDAQAEIVVAANNYAFNCLDGTPSKTGIRVYGHPRGEWVRTRRIWNQHTYHVTNIEEDGTVPRREVANWTTPGLNNFRQNVQTHGIFDAPDLVLEDAGADPRLCPETLTLYVRVVNRGRAGALAGIPVTFFGGDDVLGVVTTTRALLPGESELVRFDVDAPPAPESGHYRATLNAEGADFVATLHECRSDNNASMEFEGACPDLL